MLSWAIVPACLAGAVVLAPASADGPAAQQGGPPDRHRRRPRRGGRPPRDGPPARPAAAGPLHRAERLPRGTRLHAARPDRRRARDPEPGAPRTALLLLRGLGTRAVLVDAP